MSAPGLYPAGCLGKLPSFADFVRHNATARETLALDEWIQHGLYHAQQILKADWGRAFEHAPAYRFLYWPESSDRFIIGNMRPSRDRSGRRYPFVVSLLVDRMRYRTSGAHLAPVAFSAFLGDAERFAGLAMDGHDAQEIAGHIRKLDLPVGGDSGEEKYRDYLCATTLARFCIDVFGSCDAPASREVFENLADVLIPFRQRPIVRLSLGLRFPLSASSSRSDCETCFWIDLSQRMMRQTVASPIMFWTTDEGGSGGALNLFFRPPSPKNFVHLIMPELESDTICVLDRIKRDTASRPRYGALLQEGPLHLDALLNRVETIA